MNFRSHIVLFLCALLVIAGCATTKVTDREELVTGKISRPAHIWVYDFAATPADIPADSAIAGQYSEHSAPQTAEHIAAGRKLGAEIEKELVEQIRAMGMPAEHAVAGTTPQVNDLVIRGYLISFEEGSAAKRVGIGFGSGKSELKVAVEGFQRRPRVCAKSGPAQRMPAEANPRGWPWGRPPLLPHTTRRDSSSVAE